MSPLRVGIVGLGYGERVLLPAFRRDARFEVVGICSTTLDKAAAIQEKHQLELATGDWEDLLSRVDILALAVPPDVQVEILKACIAAGKGFFCEKPLGVNSRETGALWLAAKQKNIPAIIDFEFPESPIWQEALLRIQDARLREIVIQWRTGTYRRPEVLAPWKLDPGRGGGALGLFGSHLFYHLLLFGGEITEISSVLLHGLEADYPTLDTGVKGEVLFQTQVTGKIDLDACAEGEPYHCVKFITDKGDFLLENNSRDYLNGFTLRLPGGERFSVPPATTLEDGRLNPVVQLVGRLGDAVLSGTEASPGLREGHLVQCYLDAARQAFGHMRPVPSTLIR